MYLYRIWFVSYSSANEIDTLRMNKSENIIISYRVLDVLEEHFETITHGSFWISNRARQLFQRVVLQ